MRTTIELTEEQAARLQAIAAERGEADLARLVAEAVDEYLRDYAGVDTPALPHEARRARSIEEERAELRAELLADLQRRYPNLPPDEMQQRRERIEHFVAAYATISEDEAEALPESVREHRRSWR